MAKTRLPEVACASNFVDESNALSDNTGDIAETGIDCDKLLLTLTAAYPDCTTRSASRTVAERHCIEAGASNDPQLDHTPGEQMTYKLADYKNLTNGVIALRRAEIQKVRLEIERELREKRRDKSASSSPPSTETASSPGNAPAPHQSDSESRHSLIRDSSLSSSELEPAPSTQPTASVPTATQTAIP
jgi:hypothetical protein